MMTIATDLPNLSEGKTLLLEDRFILTQVQGSTLVFPAIWVTEILRIDRSHILALPFYDPLIVGIADSNGQTIPLLNTAKLLGLAQSNIIERVTIVQLNQTTKELKNVGLIVDRLVGTTIREKLPVDIFSSCRSAEMIMMECNLIPSNLWQPQ
jgi:chemotaxis signal transduction protein